MMVMMGAAEHSKAGVRAIARLDLVDALCVAAVIMLTALPFVTRLGFYSDDWSLLSKFHNDLAAGKFGLATMVRGFEARPLQGLQLGLQYALFGLDPIPHHLVNTTVLATAAAALYLLLVRMNLRRDVALASAFIFAVMPQLSTVRVWYAAFQVPTALLLASLSLHAQLNFIRTRRWAWLAIAGLCGLASLAAYEIFAPLILGLGLWFLASSRSSGARRFAFTLLGLGLGIVLVALVAKYLLTDRAQSPGLGLYIKGLQRLVDPHYDWRTQGSLNLFATIDVNFWQPVVGIGRATSAALRGELGAGTIVAGLAAAALAFGRLIVRPVEGESRGGGALTAIGAGLSIFVIAHTPFLISSAIMFSPTGIGNRTQVAMAIGVAMVIGGVVGLLAGRLPDRPARLVFAGFVSLLVLAGAWRTGQILSYWAEAWTIEQSIIASAKRDLARLPAGSKVIFDNVCPYHGPAIVLETWEAEGMLSLALDRRVRADSSTDSMRITGQGLATRIYGEDAFYHYGPDLYVYDPARASVTLVPDRAAAQQLFAGRRPGQHCRAGHIGQGQPI